MTRGTYPYRFPFARYPAVRLAVLFAAGLMIEHYASLSGSLILYALTGIILLLFGAEWYFRHTDNYGGYVTAIVTYLFLIIVLGIFRSSFHHPGGFMARYLQAEAGDTVLIRGKVSDASNAKQTLIHVDTASGSGIPFITDPFIFRTVTGDSSLQAGDRVSFRAILNRIPEKRNPNSYDFRSWLIGHNIYAEGRILSLHKTRRTQPWIGWNRLRLAAASLVDTCFTGRQAALARAILFGNKEQLRKKEKRAFGNAGLSHLMAVSGLHVGFLMAPVWMLLPFFWKTRIRKYAALIFIAFLLFFYGGLTGFSASVVRASLTAFLLMSARLFQKMQNPINLTAVSALVILIFRPGDLFNISFQLSFAAVFIILLLLPLTERIVPYRWQHRWYGTLLQIILVSLVVQTGLFPVLAGYFNRFSIVAPLSNAFAVPLTQVAVIWSIPCLFLAMVFPAAGHYMAIPSDILFHVLRYFILFIGSQRWSWIEIPSVRPIVYLIWLSGIFVLASCRIPELRWKWMILLLCTIVVWEGELLVLHLEPPQLSITLFDVGQGDAILVDTPGGHHLLIDTGRWKPGYNSGQDVLIPELQARGIDRINAVVLTHPHADHIGGMSALISSIPIDTIYNCGIHYDSGVYRRYIRLAHEQHIPVCSLHRGMRLWLDPSVAVFVLAPGDIHGTNPNTSSVVLKIDYGHTSFLFTGDAEKSEEDQTGRVFGSFLKTDFLKVAHHGSKTSSSPHFLKLAHPSIAAVSVGLHNRYGLPSPYVIRRLLAVHVHLHYTSLEHALEFISDGTHIRQVHWEKSRD